MREESIARHEAAAAFFKALASPVRLAILDLLIVEPRAVHQLVELTGTAQPLVSQHLGVLRRTGVVRGVRRRREIAYRLSDEHVAHIVRDALAHVAERCDQPPPGGSSGAGGKAVPGM